MYSTETPTPIQSRLDRIRERRDTPRPLFSLQPPGMSPFVRAARENRLRPTLINGAFTASDDRPAA